MTYPYRIFLSYAHADKDLVRQIALMLSKQGMQPLWDVDIKAGKPFTTEIRDLIARAHIFMPVMTPNSETRPWVHQEIGYAIALNLPILPLSIGQMPDQMIAGQQALNVQGDLSDFEAVLGSVPLDLLVMPPEPKPVGLITVIEDPEKRSETIANLAAWVINSLNVYGMVRNQARFSVFSVPTADIHDPIWAEREDRLPRSEGHRRTMRAERELAERHARQAGCKLIIDPNSPTHEGHSDHARQIRLEILLQFLRSMPEDKLQVVLSSHAQDTNLQIMGDHFFAEAVGYRRGGYVNTVINSHAPTVIRRIHQFDIMFDELYRQNPLTLSQVSDTIEKTLG